MSSPSENAATLAVAGNSALKQPDGEVLPRLVGRYVLLRLLVRGGMGEVYLATTIGIEGAERPCVVKRIRRDYRADPSFHARFLDEARVQAQLDDPGVARIMEASVDEHGDPYVVVEFVEGRSLADVRSRMGRLGKPLPWADAVAVTLEIASALAHCHERTGADGAPLGIVHRDLSPQNVMIGFGGDVKLIDFGTARGDNRRCHTVSGTVLAKPGYVAPEVARGESATPRADIYALGVMLWELVAGRRFIEGEPSDHVAAVSNGTLRPSKLAGEPSLAALGDGPVPAELDRVVAWMTEPIGSHRCARAREAAQALATILTSAPRRPVEERGVRARVKAMLSRLYPGEPAASRVEFARLVARARNVLSAELDGLSPASGGHQKTVEKSDTPSEPIMTGVPDALPGTRYRLIRRIGEGAMGVVFEAEHVDLGRRVAIKVLQAKHSSSPDYVARFRREARAIAGLSHPNLVHVYDFGQTTAAPPHKCIADHEPPEGAAGRLFFVMEKLEGETLESYLDREKGLDWRDACELGIKTCRALEAAHAAGLVHRDLKPANLFLTYGGRPPTSFGEVGLKLLDFGVAKETGRSLFTSGSGVPSAREIAPLLDDPSLSCAGAIFGTPETMAPEQATAGEVDGRADLYALGCVLYHLVTGRPVFDAPSPILLMSCHLRSLPMSPRAVSPERGIPEAVERVILRALQKDPGARFADAGEMREALEEACYGPFFDGKSVAPPPPLEAKRDEAIEILVEVGLEPMELRPTLLAPASIAEPPPSSDPFDDDRGTYDTQKIDRPSRGRGARIFAAIAGLSLLGAAGYLKRDVLRQSYDHVIAQLDARLQPEKRAAPPPRATTTTLATIAAPKPIATLTTTITPTSMLAPHGSVVVKIDSPPKPTLVDAAPPPPATTTTSPTFAGTKPPPAPVHVATKVDKNKSDKKKENEKENEKESEKAKGKPAESDATDSVDAPSQQLPAATAADVEARLSAGDPDGALTLARLAKSDGSIASLRAWARAAYAASHPVESHDACVAWIGKSGDDLEAKLLDARALRAAGRNDEAKARLEDVLKTHPSCAEAKSMLKDLAALHAKAKAKPAKKQKHRLANATK